MVARPIIKCIVLLLCKYLIFSLHYWTYSLNNNIVCLCLPLGGKCWIILTLIKSNSSPSGDKLGGKWFNIYFSFAGFLYHHQPQNIAVHFKEARKISIGKTDCSGGSNNRFTGAAMDQQTINDSGLKLRIVNSAFNTKTIVV